MGRLRYNRESFGCTVSFPDGRMGLYAHEVAPLLVDDVSHEDIARYRLETIQIDTDFHLNAPLIVWIELTRKCNLRCRHCYVGAGEPLEGELSTEELCLLLEDLKGMKALSLVITGGEPTLHKDFAHILRYACELGFVIGVATNG
ncbi:MAG TPA: radical SAM protein, partial [Candidatus Brocadiales bacterium]|nr:radical SAM protein [Candidatus Brocadiales bacterium]